MKCSDLVEISNCIYNLVPFLHNVHYIGMQIRKDITNELHNL